MSWLGGRGGRSDARAFLWTVTRYMSLNTAAKTASFFLKLELIGVRDSGIGSGASNIHGVRVSGFVEGLDPLFSVVSSPSLLARGLISPQSILDDQVFREQWVQAQQ